MKPGEIRKFFSRVPRPNLSFCDKVFLVVDCRGAAVDIMVDGVLHKGLSILYISSFSDEVS